MRYAVPSFLSMILIAIVASLALFTLVARAQPAPRLELDAGISATAPAGDIATAPAAPAAPRPSDSIDDPLRAPSAYFDDARAARKAGWPVLVLVIVRGLLYLLAGIGSRLGIDRLAFLSRGMWAAGISAGVAVVSAMLDVALLGATWFTIAAAGGIALLYLKSPAAKAGQEPASA